MTTRLFRLSLLMTASGCCALIYQIVWMRELRLVFGASTAATAAVAAVFMGGLGVGSAFLGKRADACRRPLMLYAGLELLIACLALLSPVLITAARHLYAAAGGTMSMGAAGGTVARLLLSAVILGGATVAMGGTFPALVSALQTAADADRKRSAFLYGMNTVGAVIGVLAATFWMIEIFGLRNTVRMAALVNLLIAVTARQLALRMPNASGKNRCEAHPQPVAPAGLEGRWAIGVVYLSAFTTGFVFFLMELVWYRMLSPLLGGTTYSFGLILAVALLGIGVGGGTYALIGGAVRGGLALFGVTCGIEAVLLALPYMLGDWIAVFAALTQPLGALGLQGKVLSWSLVTSAVVFPVAIVAGYQFPLLIALLGHGVKDIGRHSGNAYAFNTAGAIAGSLVGGFGLMTALSAQGCWLLSIIIMLILSMTTVFVSAPSNRLQRVAVAMVGTAAVLLVLFSVSGPTAAWRHSPIGAGRLALVGKRTNEIRAWMTSTRRHIFWEMDGRESAIGLDRSNGYAFVVNGKVDGNAIADADTQVMAGLIGAAIHPAPERSLVIGLGTGSTAGWLARVDTMAHVDVVEIEPGIMQVAKACTSVNQGVLNNPKVTVIFGDAREVLMTTDQTYDLIFSEPSNPYRAGIASLYTSEFYRAAAKRMTSGGIFMQWVQAYEIAPRTLKSIYVTLSEVFPYIDTWQTKTNDLLLLGSLTPLKLDSAGLAQKLNTAPFDDALENTWHTSGIEGFLSRFVANWEFARMLSRTTHPDWWLNTDDRMQIEFDFARSVGNQQLFPIVELRALAKQARHHRPLIEASTVAWDRVQEEATIAEILNTGGIREMGGAPATRSQRVEAYECFVQKRFENLHALVIAGRFQAVHAFDHILPAIAKAMAGDETALDDIRILGRYRPTDADAIAAIYYWTISDEMMTMHHLVRTLEQLQKDPWAAPACVMPALEIAPQLAKRDSAAIAPLMRLMEKPFSAGMLTELRLRLLLKVAATAGYEGGIGALSFFEPNVPWEADFLRYRRDAYRATGHPRLAQAERDYRLFNENDPKPLAVFIEK